MARAPEPSAQESTTDTAGEGAAPAPATTTPKTPRSLWSDGLGRAAVRSAQILLILAVVSVSIFALMQIRLLVIPILIALILAAAISPFVNLLRRRGLPGGAATAVAFILLLAVLTGVTSIIVMSVRNQWGRPCNPSGVRA